MKTAEITVSSQGQGVREALEMTEKLGADTGLGKKEILHLRLLAEELIGLMHGIAGEAQAYYWIEQENRDFALHLNADVRMNQEMRGKLLSVATSGENAAARGFMGRLREMIAVALLPKNEGPSALSDLSQGLRIMTSFSSPSAQQAAADTFSWSMNQYKAAVDRERAENEDAEAAWDVLEKSIVANIADEVSVSVKGSNAEITINKAF